MSRKITKKNLRTKTKEQLISIALDVEYRRKIGWSAYYSSMRTAINNDLRFNRRLTELIDENEELRENNDEEKVDDNNNNNFLINEFKKLMDEHKHTYNCAICLEDMDANNIAIITNCGHKYHKTCIESWKERSDKCPHCRGKFNRVV